MSNAMQIIEKDWEQLRGDFHHLRNLKKMRHRDAARQLGLSECEAVDMHIEPNPSCMRATRLNGQFAELIASLEPVGSLMALTRNESVVHEKTGTYRNVSTTGHVGLVLGEEIDLRIFYSRWKYGYWVEEDSEYQGIKTTVCSLQFFGAAGTAVHKVFQRPNSKADIFALLAKRYADDDQEPGIAVQPLDPRPIAVADHEIDALGFRAAWGAMQDTHEFFGLLKKFGVQRTQGLRLVERQFTSRVQNASARYVLREAARRGLSIMIFVGNPGCIQIHTGPVHRVELMGYWLNVMDSDFNLHLREDRIAQSWVVRKPTADGEVTSLELYDNDGETIAFIFGKRKPGIAEDNAWRALIAELGELEVEA